MADNPRIEELRRRVQADPASIAFAALAEEFRRAGRYREAIETCRTGLQRHPSYLSARVTLGRSLVEVGQFDEAREVLEHVLRAAPENLAAIRALAEIHERQGETPEALEHFRVAMQVATEDAAAAAQASAVPAPPIPVSTAKPIVPSPAPPVNVPALVGAPAAGASTKTTTVVAPAKIAVKTSSPEVAHRRSRHRACHRSKPFPRSCRRIGNSVARSRTSSASSPRFRRASSGFRRQ